MFFAFLLKYSDEKNSCFTEGISGNKELLDSAKVLKMLTPLYFHLIQKH